MKTKTITVSEVSQQQTQAGADRIIIKDHEGVSYSFFKDYEGKLTIPYQEFDKLGIKINSTVSIVYVEKENSKNPASPYKNITSFMVPTEEQKQEAPPFVSPTDKKEEDKKWERIREEKQDNIKWLNALNNACLVISHRDSRDFKEHVEYIKMDILDLANWIYKQQLVKDFDSAKSMQVGINSVNNEPTIEEMQEHFGGTIS